MYLIQKVLMECVLEFLFCERQQYCHYCFDLKMLIFCFFLIYKWILF